MRLHIVKDRASSKHTGTLQRRHGARSANAGATSAAARTWQGGVAVADWWFADHRRRAVKPARSPAEGARVHAERAPGSPQPTLRLHPGERHRRVVPTCSGPFRWRMQRSPCATRPLPVVLLGSRRP